MNIFQDRNDAGRQLALRLQKYSNRPDTIVLALPRGGVPVGFEVAKALHSPLDVFIVRKLGFPGHPEYAMGAIASGGSYYLNEQAIKKLAVPKATVQNIIDCEWKELERREREYRQNRPKAELKGRTVLVVDDGMATGASMRAAIHAIKGEKPRELIVAVPVIAADSQKELAPLVDGIVYVLAPNPFRSVGEWYAEFDQTTDEQVLRALFSSPKGVHSSE